MADAYALTNSDILLAQARVGDLDALESLCRAFEVPVYNLARRICRTPEDAEDVLQETSFEICRSIHQYRGDGSLWGWVRTIAASKAFMRLRRNKYRDGDELDEELHRAPRLGRRAAHGSGGRLGAAIGYVARGSVVARCRGLHP